MPQLLDENGEARRLPLGQLRALRALAAGSGTLADLSGRSGAGVGGGDLTALVEAGLATKQVLDIDGKVEVRWRIADAGRAALSGRDGRAVLPPPKRDRDAQEVSALVPIFGSNRTLAPKVGELLEGCAWVGVPFAGGLSEIPWIKARTAVAGDLHAHLINLAMVAADPDLNPLLRQRLTKVQFHELELANAQQRCWAKEVAGEAVVNPDEPDPEWAASYFVCAWTARNGTAGTGGEFRAPLSVRWDAGGGDSVRRFRNAVAGLEAWLELLAERVTFVCEDAFAFLAKVKDRAGHGVYCDPPFPGGLGKAYKHGFNDAAWRRLASVLARFAEAKVVVRCHDVPLARELFTEGWEWVELAGRNQARARSPEVLIVRN